MIHKPEGDELFIHDSTLQHLIHAALTHPPTQPQPAPPPSPLAHSEWTPLLTPILQGLQEPQDYEKAWDPFMQLIAQRPDFVRISTQEHHPALHRALLTIQRRLTHTKAFPAKPLIMLLPNQGFYHGAVQQTESLLVFFYFAAHNTGLCRVLLRDNPTHWMVRFQILADERTPDLESDSPTRLN